MSAASIACLKIMLDDVKPAVLRCVLAVCSRIGAEQFSIS
jgi:hypothetical protein